VSAAALRELVVVSPGVLAARAKGTPVVALETTIITHGMPYPQNVETAKAVEAIVRAGGAEPATIAVLDGRIRIGLTNGEIEALAHTPNVRKISRADLPHALVTRTPGATTVAATMICAALAGIAVFATGGIGGVHRGAETTFDISADLDQLALTPVAVVCAGAKALLDLPKTLEVLETRGVPVIAYQTDVFPAFWSRDSGLPAPLRLDTPAEIAAMLHLQRTLGYRGGALIANPVPEADELPQSAISTHIEFAVAEATQLGISGKEVTPFLLDRIYTLSGGRSLTTNVALIKNNARLAAEIARAMMS
jgi:pseudouridine-5'-phosphate glycosidase